jgi:exodeoxyribonuclease V gamma subunit
MGPQSVWLQELGLRPREREDDVEDLEPLELEERERAALFREVLAPARPMSPPGDEEAWLRRHRGEGTFPPGQGAALEAETLQERWESLEATLEPLGAERAFPLQWGAWVGCPTLRGNAVVLVHPARDRAAHRLDLWLQLQLAAAALEEVPPQRGVLIARGGNEKKHSFGIQLTFQAPTPEKARAELARLWQLRQAWRSSCWPVPPETGWMWMKEGCPDADNKGFDKVVKVWEGLAVVPGAAPVPQSQLKLTIVPSGSVEPAELNDTLSGALPVAGVVVEATAVGDWLSPLPTVTATVAVAVALELSVTVSVAT